MKFEPRGKGHRRYPEKELLSIATWLTMTIWTPVFPQEASCSDLLPDFDYTQVGYAQGKIAVPYLERKATLYFPEGRHSIDSLIRLSDGDVIRGAGIDKTILYFSKGLKGLGEECGHQGVDCYDWSNGVIRAQGKEIGIEDLTIEFPQHDWCHYCGKENQGYNGVSLLACENCWVTNVSVRNCDSGIFVEGGSKNVTIEGVEIRVNEHLKSHLHIAVSGRTSNVLVRDFKVFGSTFHGLTANWGSGSSVFSNGWGDSLRIEPDHNCNGKAGPDTCCSNIMYTNIRGNIESIQTHDRSDNTLPAIIWNVGEQTRCPVDAYQAQMRQTKH